MPYDDDDDDDYVNRVCKAAKPAENFGARGNGLQDTLLGLRNNVHLGHWLFPKAFNFVV